LRGSVPEIRNLIKSPFNAKRAGPESNNSCFSGLTLSQRVEQSGLQHGSVCILDEVKLEREAKQTSEMANRREKEAKSGQMKADGSGIEETSDPFRANLKKNLYYQTSSR